MIGFSSLSRLVIELFTVGEYEQEESAARAYDLAALKYWVPDALTNFPIKIYEGELKEMKNMSKKGYIHFLRRTSTSLSSGRSAYRGVTRSHKDGGWQARFGRFDGNKDLHLGTFNTQEEAAEAYDMATIKLRGEKAVTNFDTSRYDVKTMMSSAFTLPVRRREKQSRVQVEDKERLNEDKDDSLLGFEPTTTNVESSGPSISSCTGSMNW
ncbi:hypothetical protein SUGI_0871560 [Cryptomeria japonica]|nr:hypothetical protein SUGI_0871560 [Cryptomeria japonica]